MKGLFKFCVFLLFLYALFYARDMFIRNDIDQKAMPFVKDTVEAITTGWNRSLLDKVSDPALQSQAANAAAIGNTHILDFPFYAQLGARVSAAGCKLEDYNTFKDDTQNFISANYECAVQYEKAPANVLITVLRNKETAPWAVIYFDVSASYLSSLATSQEKH